MPQCSCTSPLLLLPQRSAHCAGCGFSSVTISIWIPSDKMTRTNQDMGDCPFPPPVEVSLVASGCKWGGLLTLSARGALLVAAPEEEVNDGGDDDEAEEDEEDDGVGGHVPRDHRHAVDGQAADGSQS